MSAQAPLFDEIAIRDDRGAISVPALFPIACTNEPGMSDAPKKIPPKKIPLSEWRDATYGTDRKTPTINTARRWARDGNIQPPAEKHGREYFVDPDARYVAFSAKPQTPRRLIDKVKHGSATAKHP